ncbi:MAG: erythromycin esterase family protein [Saprospiraceae bacterium]
MNSQTIDINFIEKSIVNLGIVNDENENFTNYSGLDSILKNVEIVMLGEQSHGEATTYDTKIKLIKYLHQNLGFDLLAFESGLYDCNKAWQMIKEGENTRIAMGKSIFGLWSTTIDLKPLASYLENSRESENPLELCGFDNQLTGKYAKEYFLEDLTFYLKTVKPSIPETKEWEHFKKNIALLTTHEFKELKKNEPDIDLTFIQNLIQELSELEVNSETQFWIQTLKSTYSFLSDVVRKTDFRDKQMAENLIWIKEKYPNRKIICWGATSHFLYNSELVRMKSPFIQILGGNYYKKQQMMGGYIKNKYNEKVFTIGFTAYQGEYGLFKKGKLKVPKEGRLEFLLGQSQCDNFLLPLKDLNLEAYYSRPIGNFYMKNDINRVMDALVFNREMRRPRLDRNFFLKIYPENKYIKPETEENKSK